MLLSHFQITPNPTVNVLSISLVCNSVTAHSAFFLTNDTENQEDDQNAMQEDNYEASDEYNLGMK